MNKKYCYTVLNENSIFVVFINSFQTLSQDTDIPLSQVHQGTSYLYKTLTSLYHRYTRVQAT